MPYNLVICAICLKKRNTSVFKVENEDITENMVTVYKTTRCHVGDGQYISVIFNIVRTPYLMSNFLRLFAVGHIILDHTTTMPTSDNFNCYSALPRVSQRKVSFHLSNIPKNNTLMSGTNKNICYSHFAIMHQRNEISQYENFVLFFTSLSE